MNLELQSSSRSMEVEIKKSQIHGTGVYAKRAYSPGDIVLKWNTANRIPKDDLKKLPVSEQKYFHPYNDHEHVLIQAPERFVNHSCENNTLGTNFSNIAVRAIAIGDEITTDYSSDGGGQSFKCTCGAHTCRGRVN